jgi:signal transduction histidine kinase
MQLWPRTAVGRLTAQSIILITPVIGALLVFLYLGAVRTAERQDETVVNEELEAAAALLMARQDGPVQATLAPLLHEREGVNERHLWVERNGVIVLQAPPGFKPDPIDSRDDWSGFDLEHIRLTRGRGLHGERLLLASAQLRLPDGTNYRLQLGRRLYPTEHTRQMWRWLLALTFVGVIAVFGALIRFMIGRSLAPAERLVMTASWLQPGQGELTLPEADRSDEFGRLARALNHMLARLEDASLLSRRFAADAAHELRTPLAGLRMMLEVADSRPRSPEEQHRLFTDALAEVARLERRVTALLQLARIEAGIPDKSKEPTSLSMLTQQIEREWHDRYSAEGVRLISNAQGDTALSSELLLIIADNLLGNALRHTPSGGQVSLTLSSANGSVQLIVADTGRGVPADQRETIWGRFRRGDDRRVDQGGSGLGLSICDAVCRQLNGTRSCDENPGGGARFTFSFPETPPT